MKSKFTNEVFARSTDEPVARSTDEIARSTDEVVRDCAVAVLQGGATRISRLVDLTSGSTIRFAMSITGHRQDAEDAVQQVLVKVAADPTKLATAGRPWSYLLGMVRNESLMILRRRRPWVGLVDCFAASLSWHLDPILAKQRHADVWRALDRLPRHQREVVVLKIWEGLTFAEIGDVLSVPLQTVASRYRYALEKLSRMLCDWNPDDAAATVAPKKSASAPVPAGGAAK
ncbi:MAG: sigma-70 family RNA polymerase sigma factor [Planctomycetota bacterium]